MVTIERLVHYYADAVTRRDGEQWSACWADDGTWVLDARREFRGRDTILRQWIAEMANYAAVVQLVANGDSVTDGDEGTGRWYFQEYSRRLDGKSGMLAAYYDDRYGRVDGGWLFTRRQLVRLYQGPPDLSGDFSNGV